MSDPFNDFDPNASNLTLWGLWNGADFIAKTRRGGLLTKFYNTRKAKLYELTPTGWVLRAAKDPDTHPDVCDNCGGSVVDTWSGALFARGRFAWLRNRSGGSVTKPPELMHLCRSCFSSGEVPV